MADQVADSDALSNLAFALRQLGDVECDAGELAAARKRYVRSVALGEELAVRLGTPDALGDLGPDSIGSAPLTASPATASRRGRIPCGRWTSRSASPRSSEPLGR